MAEPAAPATPNEVVLNLAALSRELQACVVSYRRAEIDRTKKRRAATMARARAYLKAEGTIPEREMAAKIASEFEDDEADVANALVRVLHEELRAIRDRIEIGRSYGATVRAEMSTMPYDPSP